VRNLRVLLRCQTDPSHLGLLFSVLRLTKRTETTTSPLILLIFLFSFFHVSAYNFLLHCHFPRALELALKFSTVPTVLLI
jgi:hypothetical protein